MGPVFVGKGIPQISDMHFQIPLTSDHVADMVTSFKLLGVTVTDSLRWDDHIDAITAKASKRLWFLKKLKRAGVSQSDLNYYYEAVIRPVIQYACPVWHCSLTSEQSKPLEAVQRRALSLIHI